MYPNTDSQSQQYVHRQFPHYTRTWSWRVLGSRAEEGLDRRKRTTKATFRHARNWIKRMWWPIYLCTTAESCFSLLALCFSQTVEKWSDLTQLWHSLPLAGQYLPSSWGGWPQFPHGASISVSSAWMSAASIFLFIWIFQHVDWSGTRTAQ
jgi:hypothetical protein